MYKRLFSDLDIEPVAAAEREKSVAAIFKPDRAMLTKLPDILSK